MADEATKPTEWDISRPLVVDLDADFEVETLRRAVFAVTSMYCAAIPPRKFPRYVVAAGEAYLSASRHHAARFLSLLLTATVLNPRNDAFPVARVSRQKFLKWLVDLAERTGTAYDDDDESDDVDEELDDPAISDPWSTLLELYCEELETPVARNRTDGIGIEPHVQYCYKTYFFPPRIRVTLRESNNFVCLGTTGLSSWTASHFMIDWMARGTSPTYPLPSPHVSSSPSDSSLGSVPSFSPLFFPSAIFTPDTNVLELGSGAGLAGIYILRRMAATSSRPFRSFRFSDCHPAVLEILGENVRRNVGPDAEAPEARGSGEPDFGDVKVVDLDWTDYAEDDDDDGDRSSLKLDDDSEAEGLVRDKLGKDWLPDVIFGCDIVFDKDVVPRLTNLLRHFLVESRNLRSVDNSTKLDETPPVAYIASTIRNPDTYRLFLSCLTNRGLIFNVVSTYDAETASSSRRRVPYLEASNDENPRVEIICIRGDAE